LQIESVPADQWPDLAPFLSAHNGTSGAPRCLHSDAGPDAAAYAEELRGLPHEEAVFWLARDAAGVAAAIGAEFDLELNRAWLRGPLARADAAGAQAAAALLDHLLRTLPPTLTQLDAFIEERAVDLIALYASRGFDTRGGGHHEFTAQPPFASAVPPAAVTLRAADPTARAVIGALHDEAFTRANVTADQLFEADDAQRRTRVAWLAGAPVGYVHGHFDRPWQEGYVDFLAVLPAARGQGVGRALLTDFLAWSAQAHAARAVTLTVRADRAAALGLYAACGFTRVCTGVGLRLLRS
jgi:ribosomal protein S18 acetylase RimI-like enzyme